MQQSLIDLATRRQVLLERLKAGQIRDFSKAFGEIENAIQKAFTGASGELSTKGKRYVAKFLKEVEASVSAPIAEKTKLYFADIEEAAGVYAAAESIDILNVASGLKSLKVPTRKEAFARALETPMPHSGETLSEFVESFGKSEAKRVIGRIRLGVTQGKTNADIVRSIIGTKARNYRDGILDLSRRNAAAMVRTATQHVSSTARQATWEQNSDVFSGYRWVSTLDANTTTICRSLDGREFEVGKGPVPPAHYNCRSTTVAVLAPKYRALSEGRTRASSTGPVSGKETYYDWLKRQPKSTQIEALGADRAKLFRDGGLSAQKFSDLQLDRNFRPITLDEMKKLEPDAFKRAGLN